MRSRFLPAVALAVYIGLSVGASRQAGDEYTIESFNAPPPAELAEPIRAELGQAALRLKKGAETVCEIWLRTSIPTEKPQDPLGRSYPEIPDTVLLGAMRVVTAMRDNRNEKFPTGLYVMRHGIQPQNGDHTGTTEFIDFAVLLSAKGDRTVQGNYPTPKEMHKQSIDDKGADHPIVFALLPPKAASQPNLMKNDKDRWVLEAKTGNLVLAIVIAGFYEH